MSSNRRSTQKRKQSNKKNKKERSRRSEQEGRNNRDHRDQRSQREERESKREKEKERERRKERTRNKPVEDPVVEVLSDEDLVSPDVETEGFLFIYEANGKYYRKLDDVDKTDGRSVVIHPVYYEGYNNNIASEEVTYNAEEDKYVSTSEEGSWLDVIYNYPDSVYFMDEKEVVLYDEKPFHCDGCLVDYLIGDEVSSLTLEHNDSSENPVEDEDNTNIDE